LEDQVYALQNAEKESQLEKEEILAQLGRVTSQAVSTEAAGCSLQTQLAAATADYDVEKAMHKQCKTTLAALENELRSVREKLEKEQEMLRGKLSSADSISTMQSDACRGVYCTAMYRTVPHFIIHYSTVLYAAPLFYIPNYRAKLTLDHSILQYDTHCLLLLVFYSNSCPHIFFVPTILHLQLLF
jgi:hypothetical protein